KTALDGECRLVVKGAGEQRLALEDQLTEEDHRPTELLDEAEAEGLELLRDIGPEPVAELRVNAEALCQLGVLLEIGSHALLETLELLGTLELSRIHEPHADEDEVPEVIGDEALDREQGVHAEASIAFDQHQRRGPIVGTARR